MQRTAIRKLERGAQHNQGQKYLGYRIVLCQWKIYVKNCNMKEDDSVQLAREGGSAQSRAETPGKSCRTVSTENKSVIV